MKTPQSLIRPGRATDLNAMYALDCQCFAAPFRFSRRTMATFAQAPNACTFVAESSEELFGFLIVELQQGEGYLVTLDVHPGHRRQGIAGDLLLAAEHWTTQAQAFSMSLHVAEQNHEAISFYVKTGYIPTGRINDYYGRGLNALIYCKELSGIPRLPQHDGNQELS